MSWELLPVNYTDAAWSGLKRYNQINNEDGTVSFQDVTQYSQRENSFFGAMDANRMNEALNTIMSMVENGTDLYEAFQNYFTTQKNLFETTATGLTQEEKELVDQLYATFEQYVADLQSSGDAALTEIETGYAARMANYENVQQALFDQWFADIRSTLSDDVAGQIINRMDETDEENFKRYYGLIAKATTISTGEDGSKTILENGDGAVATTTFEDTATGKIITTLLVPDTGDYKYIKTVTIEKSGGTTTIIENYTKEAK